MTIEFRDIEGVDGPFEISNAGLIRNKNNGYIYKTAISGWGYHYKTFQKKYGKTYVYIHKAIATAFIPNPENKPQVNHIDGDKNNNRVENLEWVTTKENIRHAFRTGLSKPNVKCGESHWACKITDAQVEEIKELRATGLTYKKIAEVYGCHLSNIAYICNGATRSKRKSSVC